MANQNQSRLLYGSSVSQIEQLYYSPVAVLPTNINIPVGTIYCFLSKVTPWANNTPTVPTQDQKTIKQIFKNMFVAKLVSPADMSPVIQRIDWSANTVYQYYRDDIDIFATDDAGNLINEFYVKNRYDQVFKCLWNGANTASANGAVSTNEPYFQPGQYNTDNIFFGTDGYKWKYIYTIDAGSKNKFMDTSWIPVNIGNNTPNPEVDAGMGTIDVINVINGGNNYDPANSPITITVTGDGTGATAQVGNVVDGVIQDIIVLSKGSNYTYANVTITSSAGANAVAIAPASPIGGHAFDPVSEFGCYNLMITSEFQSDENTNSVEIIPTNDANGNPIEYYQMGLLINPTAQSVYPNPANSAIYKTTTDVIVASSTDTGFVSGETVYQGATLATATFTATVLSFDSGNNITHLINTVGTPITNAILHGNTSASSRTLLTVNYPDFIIGSGYLSYVNNLTGIQRSIDGTEQFKMVLSF